MPRKKRNFIIKHLAKKYSNFKRTFKQNPIKNSLILILSFIILYFLGSIIYQYLGSLALIGYFFTCIYGMGKILKKPWRLFIWAIGYALVTIGTSLFFTEIYPDLNQKITSFSLSFLFSIIIILLLLLNGLRLRKY
ncbi:MAG: hypothetical protein ACOC3X_00755 [Nanoarchaeota archaeon]